MIFSKRYLTICFQGLVPGGHDIVEKFDICGWGGCDQDQ